MLAIALAGCNGAAPETYSAMPAPARPTEALPGHIYLFWGLAGEIFSRGLDGLAAKIRNRGVGASVHSMVEAGAVAERIARRYRDDPASAPVMLLGHSSGGDAIIAIARKLKDANVPVALAFGFDPTPVAGAVPSNIELFINLYQATNLIGGGAAVAGPDFRGRLINVDLRERREIVHITLDKNDAIHDLVIDKVVGVAAAAHARQQVPARSEAPPRKPRPARRPPAEPAEILPLTLRYVVPPDATIVVWDSAYALLAKPGDTTGQVAAAHGVPAWAVAQLNGLNADRPPRPGQTLVIPRVAYSAQRIAAGPVR